jgi:hypothetical protein
MATEYLTALPPQELLEAELERTRRILSRRDAMLSPKKITTWKVIALKEANSENP